LAALRMLYSFFKCSINYNFRSTLNKKYSSNVHELKHFLTYVECELLVKNRGATVYNQQGQMKELFEDSKMEFNDPTRGKYVFVSLTRLRSSFPFYWRFQN
jgi:hypothetical protein